MWILPTSPSEISDFNPAAPPDVPYIQEVTQSLKLSSQLSLVVEEWYEYTYQVLYLLGCPKLAIDVTTPKLVIETGELDIVHAGWCSDGKRLMHVSSLNPATLLARS